jgi:hypothetical protein
LQLDKGDIGRWCGYITGINPELYKNWINVKANTNFSNDIIIARSERYRNPAIDYSFLSKYENVKFIGVESEFNDIKKFIPEIQQINVENFLEMAEIISGCKIFIGNQSFPFSIAEGLKTCRVLEVYPFAPNVIAQGPLGYDFYFQSHFENLVENLSINLTPNPISD